MDENQLPPIGSGLVFYDLINSESIPTVRLNEILRQSYDSGIPNYSRAIADGVTPDDLSSGNLFFHEVTKEEINSKCVELYLLDPDVTQITGAVYKSQYAGIDKLNELCQQALNSDSEKLQWNLFGMTAHLPINVGDPVIFTKNHHDMGVQNGTLGTLVSLGETDDEIGIVELNSGQLVYLNDALLECIQPAYAISLHKAQGSQFPKVIIPVINSHMIDRNWLYTAITRAEDEVHIVSSKEDYLKAINRQGALLKRHTKLKDYLAESLA